jgi:ACT domain-containing protein
MKNITDSKKKLSQKELLIEQLRKTPIVQACCDKIGVSRATFYRWKKDNKSFAAKVDSAIIDGCQLINDFAESRLIEAIKDQNISAIFYWLNHRHPAYTSKVQISGSIKTEEAKLTPEQEANIRKALLMASIPEIREELQNGKTQKEI